MNVSPESFDVGKENTATDRVVIAVKNVPNKLPH